MALLLTLSGHAWVLVWLQRQTAATLTMRVMADPVLTRLIAPEQPAATMPPHPARTLARSRLASALASPLQPSDLLDPPQGSNLAAQIALSDPQPTESASAPTSAQAQELDALPPAGWPADTRVSYDLRGFYRGDLHGSARVQWQQEKGRYQVRIDIIMALLLRASMISQGSLGEQSLSPEAYEEQLLWGHRRVRFEFDRVQLQSGEWVIRPPGVQDTASQFVELLQRFSSARQVLEPGSEVRLWLARPEGMALWTYDVLAQEWLELPELGRVAAYRLRPRPIANPRGSISAEIWFAPTLKFLPVRILISLGANNFVDLLAERIEQSAGTTSTPTPVLEPQPRSEDLE